MANMDIRIINPNINLISNVSEQVNSCRSIFEFEIQTTPYAVINITRESNLDLFEYSSLSAYGPTLMNGRTSRWVALEDGSNQIQAGLSGIIRMRLKLENYTSGGMMTVEGTEFGFTEVTLTIQDSTNGVTESRRFTRLGTDAPKCEDVPSPIANDDAYTLVSGGKKLLDILSNDVVGSSYTVPTVVIVEHPQYGVLTSDSSGNKVYTHNGGGNTLPDYFTYYVKDMYGNISNTARVDITITDRPSCTSGIDFAMVVDVTASMDAPIQNVKDSLSTIITEISNKFSGNYRIALIAVTDGDPKYVISEPFSMNNEASAQTAINNIVRSAGGNTAEPTGLGIEAVLNGEAGAFRENVSRAIVMITDAPPSGDDDKFTEADRVFTRELSERAAGMGVQIFPIATGDAVASDRQDVKEVHEYYSSITNGKAYYNLNGVVDTDIVNAINQIDCA